MNNSDFTDILTLEGEYIDILGVNYEPMIYSRYAFDAPENIYSFLGCGEDLFMYSILGLEYLCQDKYNALKGEISRRIKAKRLFRGEISLDSVKFC